MASTPGQGGSDTTRPDWKLLDGEHYEHMPQDHKHNINFCEWKVSQGMDDGMDPESKQCVSQSERSTYEVYQSRPESKFSLRDSHPPVHPSPKGTALHKAELFGAPPPPPRAAVPREALLPSTCCRKSGFLLQVTKEETGDVESNTIHTQKIPWELNATAVAQTLEALPVTSPSNQRHRLSDRDSPYSAADRSRSSSAWNFALESGHSLTRSTSKSDSYINSRAIVMTASMHAACPDVTDKCTMTSLGHYHDPSMVSFATSVPSCRTVSSTQLSGYNFPNSWSLHEILPAQQQQPQADIYPWLHPKLPQMQPQPPLTQMQPLSQFPQMKPQPQFQKMQPQTQFPQMQPEAQLPQMKQQPQLSLMYSQPKKPQCHTQPHFPQMQPQPRPELQQESNHEQIAFVAFPPQKRASVTFDDHPSIVHIPSTAERPRRSFFQRLFGCFKRDSSRRSCPQTPLNPSPRQSHMTCEVHSTMQRNSHEFSGKHLQRRTPSKASSFQNICSGCRSSRLTGSFSHNSQETQVACFSSTEM